jgi:hypothetical protein
MTFTEVTTTHWLLQLVDGEPVDRARVWAWLNDEHYELGRLDEVDPATLRKTLLPAVVVDFVAARYQLADKVRDQRPCDVAC